MRLLYVFALSVLSLLIHARTTDENLQVARYLVERLAMSPESIDNLDLLARRALFKAAQRITIRLVREKSFGSGLLLG